MRDRSYLENWVVESLTRLGGRARRLDVFKDVWLHHEKDIRAKGDLIYQWQYELSWASSEARKKGKLVSPAERGIWELV